jgi:hypothetical protein
VADVEIMARVERRRKWSAREKAALLAEVEAEGGKVTVVARRRRISECDSAWKKDPVLECAPAGGQFEFLDLTPSVGFSENGNHDKASFAQRSIQAPGG